MATIDEVVADMRLPPGVVYSRRGTFHMPMLEIPVTPLDPEAPLVNPDGEPVRLIVSFRDRYGATVGEPRSTSRHELAELVRSTLLWAYTHEIDEWLTLDGLRLRNPHPELGDDYTDTYYGD